MQVSMVRCAGHQFRPSPVWLRLQTQPAVVLSVQTNPLWLRFQTNPLWLRSAYDLRALPACADTSQYVLPRFAPPVRFRRVGDTRLRRV